MLIGFIGCPKSGKTSVAIRVFDSLKTSGDSCELLTEEARKYFVEKKYDNPSDPSITDNDQIQIFKRQLSTEIKYLKTLNKTTTIISDSSPLNTLWYLTPKARKENFEFLRESLKDYLTYKPLIFKCEQTPGRFSKDEGRIHDERQSNEVHLAIPSILKEFDIPIPKYVLEGSLNTRVNKVLTEYYERVLTCGL